MEIKKYTKEEVLDFNPGNWVFRSSSGYAGYDPKNSDYNLPYPDESKWIYESDYMERKRLKLKYYDDYNLISEFRGECLPFGEYPEYVIQEFLNKKYFK